MRSKRSVAELLSRQPNLLGQIQTEKARRRLLDFAIATRPDYRPGWHHRVLCAYLDRFARGEILRLAVMMPPRHGKSELVSRCLPAYLLGRNPDAEVIACSYAADLASRMNRDVQRIIDSQPYRDIFPETRIWGKGVKAAVGDSASARNNDIFEIVDRRGSYRSAGVGGGITGMGFRYGIIDDPVKNREEADSPTKREAAWEWYTSTFYSRRAPGAGILVTMTRWNEDDLLGRLLKQARDNPLADQWTVLKFPAIAGDERHPDDPRQPGEALWPEQYPKEDLEKSREASPYDWSGLYQQDPRGQGTVEWPSEWFGDSIWFDDWPKDLQLRVIFLDPSKGKDSKHGDYSALIAMGRCNKGTLWIEANLARRPTDQIIDDGFDMAERFQRESCGALDGFGVEANQFQELLADQYITKSRETGIQLPIFKVVNNVNKQVRIRRLTPYLSSKNLRIRANPGGRLLIQQLKDFPIAAHDDGPDAVEGALRLAIEIWNGKAKRR